MASSGNVLLSFATPIRRTRQPRKPARPEGSGEAVDKIDVPENLFRVGSAAPADEEFLEECGILTRSRGPFRGGEASALLAATIEHTFEKYEKEQPGQWVLGRDVLVGRNTYRIRKLELSINDALPFPQFDVPLADVLQFKHRRQDELLALRLHIEELCACIRNAEDKNQVFATKSAQVQKDIIDLRRVLGERRMPTLTHSVSFDIPLRDVINQALIGGVAAEYWFSMAELGAVAGAAAAVIPAIKIQSSLTRSSPVIPDRLKPYQYALAAEKEFGSFAP
jgi:hypothetical protein